MKDYTDRILSDAQARMDMGTKRYGEFDPESDERDLLQETIDEGLDMFNYLRMFCEKPPGGSSDCAASHRIMAGVLDLLMSLYDLQSESAYRASIAEAIGIRPGA